MTAVETGLLVLILVHEDDQNPLHPVETEPFGCLVPNNVRDALGNLRTFYRCSQIFRLRHVRGMLAKQLWAGEAKEEVDESSFF